MDKKKLANQKILSLVSEAAYIALDSGKGNNAIGMTDGITLDTEYTLLGADYVEGYFAPKDMSDEDFRELSEEQRQEQGVKRGWFVFNTNNGNLSFSAVIGDTNMYKPEFWDDTANKADDFDVTKIIKVSCRTPSAWIKQGCDDLIGKTIKCVATKTFKRGAFDVKARAFVIV